RSAVNQHYLQSTTCSQNAKTLSGRLGKTSVIFPLSSQRCFMKFTQAAIAKFKMPEGKIEHIEFDDNMSGFGLRVRNSGKREHRTYILQYKIGPKQRRITLGNVGKIGLHEAQKKAKKLFGAIADGKDPANEKALARTEASHTFDVLASAFLGVQR